MHELTMWHAHTICMPLHTTQQEERSLLSVVRVKMSLSCDVIITHSLLLRTGSCSSWITHKPPQLQAALLRVTHPHLSDTTSLHHLYTHGCILHRHAVDNGPGYSLNTQFLAEPATCS
jgi:hypothetical protein